MSSPLPVSSISPPLLDIFHFYEGKVYHKFGFFLLSIFRVETMSKNPESMSESQRRTDQRKKNQLFRLWHKFCLASRISCTFSLLWSAFYLELMTDFLCVKYQIKIAINLTSYHSISLRSRKSHWLLELKPYSHNNNQIKNILGHSHQTLHPGSWTIGFRFKLYRRLLSFGDDILFVRRSLTKLLRWAE